MSVKLKYLDSYSKARNQVAEKYDLAFANHSHIQAPARVKNSTHVFHQYTVKLEPEIDREDFKNYLESKEIPSMVYYPLPLHLQKAYLEYGGKEGQFPVSERLCQHVISFPIHTEMDPAEQTYIIDQILAYFK